LFLVSLRPGGSPVHDHRPGTQGALQRRHRPRCIGRYRSLVCRDAGQEETR
jgi:hypothetical protein